MYFSHFKYICIPFLSSYTYWLQVMKEIKDDGMYFIYTYIHIFSLKKHTFSVTCKVNDS